jgi:hypothetical protein
MPNLSTTSQSRPPKNQLLTPNKTNPAEIAKYHQANRRARRLLSMTLQFARHPVYSTSSLQSYEFRQIFLLRKPAELVILWCSFKDCAFGHRRIPCKSCGIFSRLLIGVFCGDRSTAPEVRRIE